MSKKCPECGNEVPDDAHFCADCGHDFFQKGTSRPKAGNSDSIFSNGKIFLFLIAAVLIIGAIVILSSGLGGNGGTGDVDVDDNVEHVYLTISDVSGTDGVDSGKEYYFLWTEVLFTSVPSDQKGYLIKTTYCDENGTRLGQETEKLANAYYETDYSVSIGYHTMYKKPDLDHVDVEIIKDGKTIDNYTYEVDKNKISFLS